LKIGHFAAIATYKWQGNWRTIRGPNLGHLIHIFLIGHFDNPWEKAMTDEIETTSDDSVICPYCGFDDPGAIGDLNLFKEGETEMDCGACDKEFTISVSVSYAYESKKKNEGPEIINPYPLGNPNDPKCKG
jgi:hypothetical protein